MNLVTLFFTITMIYHLPPDLLSKVCFVESSFNISAVRIDSNGLHSIGICQVQLRTAESLGFRGSEEDLLDPHINVLYAGAYLSHQFVRYGNWVKAIKAYNAGFAKNNKPNTYYRRVCSVNLEEKNPMLLAYVK